MDLNTPFLTKQIIAYIGNKRKLLPLIYRALTETIPDLKPGQKFLDVFAGSGVVSRLAKHLNLEVYANDWEHYSYIINNAYIGTNLEDITPLFGSEQKFRSYLREINELPPPDEEYQYITRYYAPGTFDIEAVDFHTERLFYTRDNALQIDKIRNFIEENHPEGNDNRVRNLLLGSLLYQAATHTNTSGVFKAFHKGFGGHTKIALKRILAPIRLAFPVLIDSDYLPRIFKEDADRLIKREDMQNVDIAYLDPPYNQHQYGSNYHLLNTIALWDKCAAPLTLTEGGILKEKAAIRKDWIKTKSDYCYSRSALSAFTNLMKNLKARYILISYSTDGLIPFDVMKDICAQRGKISILSNEYTRYPGGKQSNTRGNTNIEFILIVETEKRSTQRTLDEVKMAMSRKEVLCMFKKRYNRQRLQAICEEIDNDSLFIQLNEKRLVISTIHNFELVPPEGLETLSLRENEELLTGLRSSMCRTKEEELEEIILRINRGTEVGYFMKLIPPTLGKLAHKKNRERFFHWLSRVKQIEKSHPAPYSLIKGKLLQVEETAHKRFSL